jgi:hypothetical protein
MRKTMLWSSVVAVGLMAVAWAVVSYLTMDRTGEGDPGADAGYEDGRGEKHRGPGKGNVRRMVRPIRKPVAGHTSDTDGDPEPPLGAGSGEWEGGEPPVAGEDAEACEECGEPWPLTAEGIQGAVNAGIDDIKHCYEQWLKLEPDIAGSIVVTFTITEVDEGVGGVSDIELADSELEHPFIEGCVLNVFAEMPFEAPADGGEVEVNYPLMFDTGEEDHADPDGEE